MRVLETVRCVTDTNAHQTEVAPSLARASASRHDASDSNALQLSATNQHVKRSKAAGYVIFPIANSPTHAPSWRLLISLAMPNKFLMYHRALLQDTSTLTTGQRYMILVYQLDTMIVP
jgi:hypothetical protein